MKGTCVDVAHIADGYGGADCELCWHRWFWKNYQAPAIRRSIEKRRKPKAAP